MGAVLNFLKREKVLAISLVAAVVSMIFVAPDSAYLEYVDWNVLMLLFSLMAVVCGLKRLGAFDAASAFLSGRAKNKRALGALLTLACFFFSMLVTNDVSLITFVPLTIMLLSDDSQTLIYVISLETVAANLGSMATPIGNPQNLYLYSRYDMSISAFTSSIMPLAAISFALVLISCLLIKKEPVSAVFSAKASNTPAWRYIICAIQFILCLLSVFKLIPVYVSFAAVLLLSTIFDIKSLLRVDYALLFTFICFFVFVGNIGRIDAVNNALSSLIAGRELETGIIASQVISNVPAAIMLSGFTDDSQNLMRGVDIGGLGTIVASLASLISFKLYMRSENAKPLKYLAVFTAMNAIFLVILYASANIM